MTKYGNATSGSSPPGEVVVVTPATETFSSESWRPEPGHVVVLAPIDTDGDSKLQRAETADGSLPERVALLSGWRRHNEVASLQEVKSSIKVPEGAWYKKVFAFAGLGFMISVAYMGPGNWATDLSGGAAFGYTLLSVILFRILLPFSSNPCP